MGKTDLNSKETIEGVELYQDEFLRKPNGLLYTMRNLFDNHKLTTWEFQEFMKIVRSFCKEYDLHFDEKTERLWKKRKLTDLDTIKTNNESYVGKECFFIDNVTANKRFDGCALGKCLEEGIHDLHKTPIVWFEKPFLGFTWHDKSVVRL